jgi:hypothetical protein
VAERAYHYTDIAHLPYILDAGHIRRSRHIMAKVRADVPSGIVWFSTHHRADPSTASFNNGGATPRVRLCVPQGITLDWREACRKAGWSEPDI